MSKRNIIIVCIIGIISFFVIYGIIYSFKENKEVINWDYKDNTVIVPTLKFLDNINYFSCKNKAKRVYKTQLEYYKIVQEEKEKSEKDLAKAIEKQ